jgi:hypothetical protein
MATKASIPASDRLTQSLQQLSDSAARLNAASEEFSKAVAPIEAALKKLNLGVTAWHRYDGSQDRDGDYWERRIGYAKIGGKWGLALATISGSVNYPDVDEYEHWLFNDAPRWMRIEAIDHVPALLDELVRQADKTAADLRTKTETARELATTIAGLTADARVRR